MADFHRRCDEVVQAASPGPPKQTLQVTWRQGDTCSVPFEQAGFRHLHPTLIERAKDFDKVVLVHPETEQRRVVKDDGNSVEPFYEQQ